MWTANMSLTYKIIKGLTFKTAGTYNTNNSRTDIFYQEKSRQSITNGTECLMEKLKWDVTNVGQTIIN